MASIYMNYLCGDETVKQCPTTCSLPQCAVDQGFTTTTLKQGLNGTGNTPFVRLAFVDYRNQAPVGELNSPDNEFESIVITTGNQSSYFAGPKGTFSSATPDCSAVIQSFQYSWGAVHSGTTCKITIMDQEGSSFSEWMKKLMRNIEGAAGADTGVFKMKVKWGWILTNTGGQDCPTPVVPFTTTVSGQPVTYYAPAQGSTRIFCSPECYFLPNNVVVNMQNGKFIYELDGIDTFQRSQENLIQAKFGGTNAISFKQAVINLSRISTPRFMVKFLQRNINGQAEEMNFAQFLGSPTTPVAASQSTPAFWCPHEGPSGVWGCNGKTPLVAIKEWLNYVRAQDPNDVTGRGVGITFNFDPTYTCSSGTSPSCFQIQTGVKPDFSCTPSYVTSAGQPPRGQLLLWADAFASCRQANDPGIQARVIGTYIVGGGNCSPVISFTPNIKWNLPFSMLSLRAGGGIAPAQATVRTNNFVPVGAAQQRGAICGGIGGTGLVKVTPTLSNNAMNNGSGLTSQAEAIGVNKRANQLFTAIEAELKVQGDPSSVLCTPFYGYGKSVSLVVMNPFFVSSDTVTQTTGTVTTTVPPYGAASGCPGWSTLSASNCNSPLTNKNWMVKGVDHQIKAGSYLTTYKLMLFAPGSDGPEVGPTPTSGPLADGLLYLGLDVASSLDFYDKGSQSTVACVDRWPDGSDYVSSRGLVGTACVDHVFLP